MGKAPSQSTGAASTMKRPGTKERGTPMRTGITGRRTISKMPGSKHTMTRSCASQPSRMLPSAERLRHGALFAHRLETAMVPRSRLATTHNKANTATTPIIEGKEEKQPTTHRRIHKIAAVKLRKAASVIPNRRPNGGQFSAPSFPTSPEAVGLRSLQLSMPIALDHPCATASPCRQFMTAKGRHPTSITIQST